MRFKSRCFKSRNPGRFLILLCCAGFVFVASGCGKKGELYLPAPPAQPVPAAPAR